jgi:hypothetical protein
MSNCFKNLRKGELNQPKRLITKINLAELNRTQIRKVQCFPKIKQLARFTNVADVLSDLTPLEPDVDGFFDPSAVPQSGDFLDSDYLRKIVTDHIVKSAIKDLDTDWYLKLVEDLFCLAYWFCKDKSYTGRSAALAIFIKLRIKGPLIKAVWTPVIEKFKEIFTALEPQADDESSPTEKLITSAREFVDQYGQLKKSPFFKKIYKFSMYLLSFELFKCWGVTFDSFKYSKIEAELVRKEHSSKHDFVYTILDTITFLSERGYQCMKLGSLDPIYHSGKTYEEWAMKAMKHKAEGEFLNNPEAHGIVYEKYMMELDDLIFKGDAMYKRLTDKSDKSLIAKLLQQLQYLRSMQLTKQKAMKERKPPLAICFTGPSSIAKSLLCRLAMIHYGRVCGLPYDSEYMYTRNCVDPYWVNFRSCQWCILLDDIAMMLDNKSPNGDLTMLEIIQLINSVPYSPPQAAIEDKGTTPVISRLVLGTSNNLGLNAVYNFVCPLAPMRRFKFYVDVTIKPQFAKHGQMLDATKVDPLDTNEYPDYWLFDILEAVPADNDKEPSRKFAFKHLYSFGGIYEFLEWWTQVIVHNNLVEDKIEVCDKMIRNVELCKCFLPAKHCRCDSDKRYFQLQADDDEETKEHESEPSISESTAAIDAVTEEFQQTPRVRAILDRRDEEVNPPTWEDSLHKFFLKLVYGLLFGAYNCFPLFCFLKYTVGIGNIFQCALWLGFSRKTLSMLFGAVGNRVYHRIGHNEFCVRVSIFMMTFLSTYAITTCLLKLFAGTVDSVPHASDSASKTIGVTPAPEGNGRENVWYKNDYQLTPLEVSPAVVSNAKLSDDDFNKLLLPNMYKLIHRRQVDGVPIIRKSTITAVSDFVYLTNAHIFDGVRGEFELVQAPQKDGITSNIKVTIHDDRLYFIPNTDIVLVHLRFAAPKKNIVQYFPTRDFNGCYDGYYLGKDVDGSVYRNNLRNMQKILNFTAPSIHSVTDSWFGYSTKQCVNGDCGALSILRTGLGPVIAGFHYLGREVDNAVYSHCVTRDQLELGISHFCEFTISPSPPVLNTPGFEKPLEDLHRKSPVRFVPQGIAEVYGSFPGFRATRKSGVELTILCEYLEGRGYKNEFVAPELCSWRPWYCGLEELVHPRHTINTEILTIVRKQFTADILSELGPQDLAMVEIYDDLTALNGAAGVAYVDKINRNTSAGFPFNKSKKYFLNKIPPVGQLLDPVDITPPIQDMIDVFLEKYQNKSMASPVFAASLKDEAVKRHKRFLARQFSGAPLAWSLIVRKYLLSVVRLIQNKRFVFESAPATIAQSLEWQEIYEFVTSFGTDRIIAGDFKKFDKSASAEVILQAFHIIIDICRAAGYPPEALQIIFGISVDTAFNVVDFNGDLIRFYGSNPSGHPLTVIINGLVNCLYMRYAYFTLNPSRECVSFRSNVHLMTYGDDNLMGSRVDWFNHTAIQEVLSSIGIVYTMADKEAQSVPFVNITTCDFLKRKFRWDADVGAFLCPLEHASIAKMLMIGVVSKHISKNKAAVENIAGALREYWYYGKKVFEQRTEFFKQLVLDLDLEVYVDDTTFVSWETWKNRFWKNSMHVKLSNDEEVNIPPGLGDKSDI